MIAQKAFKLIENEIPVPKSIQGTSVKQNSYFYWP